MKTFLMFQFLLFCHDDYYPTGGMFDYCAGFTTLEDALEEASKRRAEKFHVLDLDTFSIVAGNHPREKYPIKLPFNLSTGQGITP